MTMKSEMKPTPAVKELTNLDDIRMMVDSFYHKVREDDLLQAIFNNTIEERWPEHLEKMYRFWQTLLLEEHTYHGAPFAPHAVMPLTQQHFQRWLELFHATVDELFAGEKAELAKERGSRIAEVFLAKMQYLESVKTQ